MNLPWDESFIRRRTTSVAKVNFFSNPVQPSCSCSSHVHIQFTCPARLECDNNHCFTSREWWIFARASESSTTQQTASKAKLLQGPLQDLLTLPPYTICYASLPKFIFFQILCQPTLLHVFVSVLPTLRFFLRLTYASTDGKTHGVVFPCHQPQAAKSLWSL